MPQKDSNTLFEAGALAAHRLLWRAALCLLLILCGGGAALAQPSLVSVNASGTASGNGASDASDLSLSHDGRFVAFVSDAPDLVINDTNGAIDVFVRDLATSTTTLVSFNAAGTSSGNARSGVTGTLADRSFAISGNGRFVAFTSAASDLVASDTNGRDDLFVRDVLMGTTTLVSANSAGTNGGNGASVFPFITPDGSSVGFWSSASDLVANDTNGAAADVFVRRLNTGTTILVSVNAAGTGSGNDVSVGGSISDDGRYVAFTSRAGNLVANDTNGTARRDIFLRDLTAGTTTLVSATPDNAASGNFDSSGALVSADGARVVFHSGATNLVGLTDTNQAVDIFVREIQTATTTLVSVNRHGTGTGSDFSSFLSISAISTDGNIIAFTSRSPDIVANDTNGQVFDVFVRNVAAATTTLVSVDAVGVASGNGPSDETGSLSGDGRFVTFRSLANNLVTNDDDPPAPGGAGAYDVFVRDLHASKTTLLSVDTAGHSGSGDSLSSLVSRNGSVAVFTSDANDLDPRDTDTQRDVFSVSFAGPVQFSADTFTADEGGGAVTITVTRTGNTTGEAFVNYATADISASERRDYTAALGRLRFAPGETSKSFQIVIADDRFNDDGESFSIAIAGPTGATLGAPATAIVNINDNDAADGPSPVRAASFNTEFFVRQHYADFLNRVPDAGGLAFWIDGIESCGADQQCREVTRINTSAAFFLSIEFQETGFLAHRTHKAAFGDLSGKPVPVRLRDFLSDSRRIGEDVVVGRLGWPEQLEANKVAYFNEFVTRLAFTAIYPHTLSAAQFVDALFAKAGVQPTQSERDAAINAFGAGGSSGRAAALRAVAESQTLQQAETSKAFVLMQYFGYLRRNPDDLPDTNFDGYNFWLKKLNQFNGNFIQAEMVKAFIQSIEYGDRFGQ